MGELYEQICSWDNLRLAHQKAARGKRGKRAAAAFEYNLADHLLELQRELETQTYQPGLYQSFYIHDPKRRLISAAPFRDRVVHHALCNVIEPMFERSFIYDSYANRVGKGTHAALDRFTFFARRFRYVLPCDVRQFFPSVDHAILREQLARVIHDEATLWLCDRILESGAGVLSGEYTPGVLSRRRSAGGLSPAWLADRQSHQSILGQRVPGRARSVCQAALALQGLLALRGRFRAVFRRPTRTDRVARGRYRTIGRAAVDPSRGTRARSSYKRRGHFSRLPRVSRSPSPERAARSLCPAALTCHGGRGRSWSHSPGATRPACRVGWPTPLTATPMACVGMFFVFRIPYGATEHGTRIDCNIYVLLV